MAFLIFTMYDTIFFHSSVGGHLDCFPNVCYCEYYSEHGSYLFEILISVLLGIYSEVGFLDHMIVMFLIF